MKKQLLFLLVFSFIFLSFVKVNPPGVNLSTSPILHFSNTSGLGDHIINDGDAGSTLINDLDLQIYPINNTGTMLTAAPLEYHDGTQSNWFGYPPIITYGTVSNYGWTIKSTGGTNFSLKSLNFLDWGYADGRQYTIECFNGGISRGSFVFNGNIGASYLALSQTSAVTALKLPPAFGNVDEVRISSKNGDSYITLNDIQVAPAVFSGYDFENITPNAQAFTHAGHQFTLTGDFVGQIVSSYGSASPPSNGYSDTGNGTRSGNVGGIKTANGETFRLVSLDIWPSANGGSNVLPYGAQVKVIGKKNGVQVAAGTFTSTTFNQTPIATGGAWHRLTISGVLATTDIDAFEIELQGTQNYMAIDQFDYSNFTTAPVTPAPAITSQRQHLRSPEQQPA
ncbi:MAG: hypothetical protein P0Y49_00565 [Candidatus Pedobacter colombiensis]|uniref:Uncharacterized protein n=1 Tax=Candidatus Pedobacter colombiensis TaxID=3121371 RepID=A0AAJ5WBC6_9SPHI|nr:hypothetical protein [Pedobacter sp.]WEK19647.1 MAG: hypothetical protein P0Y49_00565 [Pedobacter sp.]